MSANSMKMESIQCTVRGCSCDCFSPGKTRLRVCDTCEHGWVVHAMDKMAYRTPAHQVSGQSVEVVQPNIVFDIASLMLYGSQASPIRLKILLDRLFSVVQHDEVVQVLHSFGWSYEDYARGYILHDSSGRVLDKWSIATYEEEQLILQQFLRFGETKAIAQELIARDGWDQARQGTSGAHCLLGSRTESDIKKFIERSNVGMQSFIKGYDAAQQLLSRTFMYPHLATAGFARLLTPTILHNLSPAVAIPSRDKPGLSSPATTNIINPLSRSPLRSLQTMEPFDYRKEAISSPKTTSTAAVTIDGESPKLDGRTLLNLAVAGQATAIPAVTGPHLMMVKTEVPEEKPGKGSAAEPKQLRETISTEGAINYSIKDMRIATSASAVVFPSPVSTCAQSSIAAAAAATAAAAAVSNPSSSIFAHQKLKHLRKSSNPMKRPWQPTPGYGGTLISPSGKKRVLCTACHKTFCDKGALKIHYSAVHLKEMHRCTVDGCTMMFSSRRSRNRHSANPNPKLHMPQTVRRKLPDNLVTSNQDDDDDDDNAFSPRPASLCHDEGSGGGVLLAGPGFPSRPHPVVLDVMSDSSEADSAMAESLIRPHAAFPLVATPRFFLNPGLPAVVPLPAKVLVEGPRQSQPTVKASPVHPAAEQETPDDTKKCEETKESLEATQEQGQSRSSSKRKSAVPTRCSLQTDDIVSDDNSVDESPDEKKPCRRSSNHLSPAEGVDGARGTEIEEAILPGRNHLDHLKGTDSNSATEPLTSSEVQLHLDVGSEKENSSNIDLSHSPIRGSEVTDGRGIPGPRTSTPSSSTATSPGRLHDNIAIMTSQQSSFSENLSMTSSECEERSQRDRTRATDGTVPLESPGRDNSEINDSGVADMMRSVDEAEVDGKCHTCNKSFQTHFGARSPSTPEPAHTKCNHACIVKGCNATFPSKRSRDRHSANLNLHRRLLSTVPQLSTASTTVDKMTPEVVVCDVTSSGIAPTVGERQEGMDRSELEVTCTVLNLSKNVQTPVNLEFCGSNDSVEDGNAGSGFAATVFLDAGKKSPRPSSNPPPPPPPSSTHGMSSTEIDDSQSVDSPVVPSMDASGSVVCHICQDPFKDNLALKEHQEHAHPREMYRCTIGGCDKIFSTRKSRNRHSQNENLHKHLLVNAGANATPVSTRQLAL